MVEAVFAIGKSLQIPGVLAQAIWALLMQIILAEGNLKC